MKNFYRIVFALLMLVLFFNCKKTFEDGPLISLRSPLKRILGSWEVSKISENGQDVTTQYKTDSLYALVHFYTNEGNGFHFILQQEYVGAFEIDENMLVISHAKSINYNGSYFPLYFPPFVLNSDTISTWEIKTLKFKELLIEGSIDNNKYKIALHKKYKINQ
jgi:hypothetical protein